VEEQKPKTVRPADRSVDKPKPPIKPSQPEQPNKVTSNKELLEMIRNDELEKKNREFTRLSAQKHQ